MVEDEIVSRLKQDVGAQCVLETFISRTRRIFVHVNKKYLEYVSTHDLARYDAEKNCISPNRSSITISIMVPTRVTSVL
jgi:hypothetical protein